MFTNCSSDAGFNVCAQSEIFKNESAMSKILFIYLISAVKLGESLASIQSNRYSFVCYPQAWVIL